MAERWSRITLDPREEEAFQRDFRASPFFQEFTQRHGEAPDLEGDYDYRAWWKDGMEATRHHDGTLHGPSKTKGGQWLKAPDHPTAWKETFMQQYGMDPDLAQPFVDPNGFLGMPWRPNSWIQENKTSELPVTPLRRATGSFR